MAPPTNSNANVDAYLDRLDDEATPLSQRQQDTIAAAFAGALHAPRGGHGGHDAHVLIAVPGPGQQAAAETGSPPLPAPTSEASA